MNTTNLLILADYLEKVSPPHFNMAYFALDEHDDTLPLAAHECGTVCCAVGHGPAAGLPPLPSDEDWSDYSERVFGLLHGGPSWNWCFAASWAFSDNTPTGAANRIRHLVHRGLPRDSYSQRIGINRYMGRSDAAPAPQS